MIGVRKRFALIAAMSFAGLLLGTSAQAVEVELGLGLDGSGSISSGEFQLQLDAYASVLQDASIVPRNDSIALGIYQFASSASEIFPTTVINNESILDLISAIEATTKLGGGTNIGQVVIALQEDMLGNGIESERQLIDVSTDGFGSVGSSVTDAVSAGIDQVNCLGIGASADCDFIGGDGAFAYTVEGFDDFEDALRLKVGRETGQEPADVPEPGALLLVASGLLGLVVSAGRLRYYSRPSQARSSAG